MRVGAVRGEFERFVPGVDGSGKVAVVIEADAEVEECGSVAFDLETALVGEFGLGEVARFEMGDAFFEEALRFFVGWIERG